MKKFENYLPMSATITIDIETLPSETMPELHEVQAPKNYTNEDKIALYKVEKREELWRKESLISHKGRILAIGYAINDLESECIIGTCEQDIMEKFDLVLSQFTSVKFVGKSTSFDVLFIWQRALKYNCKNVLEHLNPANKKNIIDITYYFGQWIDYRYMVSLDNIAKFFGFESSKSEDIDGSKVFDAFLDGKIKEIEEYCKRDVDLTRKIYNLLNDRQAI